VCGGVFSEPSAVLKSPFYPNSYPTNRVCIYEIELPPGQAVELCFQDFEVEDTFSPPCRYDYLEVSYHTFLSSLISYDVSYKILLNILLSRLSLYIDEIIGDQQCGLRHNS
jgi:hypothetical protein